jgi:hypothetical protein
MSEKGRGIVAGIIVGWALGIFTAGHAMKNDERRAANATRKAQGIEQEAAKTQALLLEYYGLLLDAGFGVTPEGKWIKPKVCK